MATASYPGLPAEKDASASAKVAPVSGIKRVPPREIRELIRHRAEHAARDSSVATSRASLEATALSMLESAGLPGDFLGWSMVALASAAWRRSVMTVNPAKRLFVLPAPRNECPADSAFGNRPVDANADELIHLAAEARAAGYQVLAAESFVQIAERVFAGDVEAIVGVADLDALERAFEQALPVGLPCMAVPLVEVDDNWRVLDPDWAEELLRLPYRANEAAEGSVVGPGQALAELFQPENLERFLRDAERAASSDFEPLTATARIAHDFLLRGGKHSRPFITLATYHALNVAESNASHATYWSRGVLGTALAIETFHKASLVHDDIEDDDAFRYGEPTLHRRHGTAAAINLGDYLIGLGYRLVSRERTDLGADVVAEILDHLALAHLRLAEGQGAELFWRQAADKHVTPADALSIYSLKTAPAFGAALFAGCRLAGPVTPQRRESLDRFAHELGVAFQIVNDLDDWRVDSRNKRRSGGDVLAGRPTVLWALALEGLPEVDSAHLLRLVRSSDPADSRLPLVAELYEQSAAFARARTLVGEHRQRAEAIARDVDNESLQQLLLRLVQWVLTQVPLVP